MAENAIGEILGQTLETLGALEQALRAESEALAGALHDPEAIAAATQRKQELVAEINSLVQNIDRQLVNQGLAVGRAGLEAWLAALPEGDALRGAWQAIVDMGQRCKGLNETNGLQIGLLNRRTQDALRILLGGDAAGETYGPDGSGRIVPGSRSSYTV